MPYPADTKLQHWTWTVLQRLFTQLIIISKAVANTFTELEAVLLLWYRLFCVGGCRGRAQAEFRIGEGEWRGLSGSCPRVWTWPRKSQAFLPQQRVSGHQNRVTMASGSSDLGLKSPLGSYWLCDLESLHSSDLSFLSCKMACRGHPLTNGDY